MKRVRSSAEVASAIYADATPMLAAKAPATNRATKIAGSVSARPSQSSDAPIPATQKRITGRRP